MRVYNLTGKQLIQPLLHHDQQFVYCDPIHEVDYLFHIK